MSAQISQNEPPVTCPQYSTETHSILQLRKLHEYISEKSKFQDVLQAQKCKGLVRLPWKTGSKLGDTQDTFLK